VRALVNAGVPVRWVPVVRAATTSVPRHPGDAIPLGMAANEDESLADLPRCSRRRRGRSTATSSSRTRCPSTGRRCSLPGKAQRRHDGLGDRPHPRALAHAARQRRARDRAVHAESRRVLAGGVRRPVHIVPHVRRHAWNAFAPSELDAARERFGLGDARFVFYAINAWDPRKALPTLLTAFVRAFTQEDGVALVLKTGPVGYGAPPFYTVEPTLGMAQRAVDAATDALDRDAPTICVLPYELSGRGVDMVHAIGDAYVSLSHGEGFALGLFDAATRGTPAIATGWGGHLDYLAPDWPGAVPYRMASVPVWPPWRPSYWPSQQWAVPDADAAIAAMRALAADPAPARAAAATIAESIANRYAEPIVAKMFVEALA
jgi:hypothetical protein